MFTIEIEDGCEAPCLSSYTFLACLFDCLFVSNKVKMAEPIESQFLVGPHSMPGKVYESEELKNLPEHFLIIHEKWTN